ncbi:hypothetical protein [Fictibacillus fluitans]|uniref:Uncharacterized protein n=1 Tax=Fictibacillus fluitans TaxID=3058422 RepID=A0ABT8HZW5_9BACL|nr:hypothetical protein [Fictibacillus sp. NE201]MDN4526323.1 hypothetical protein [Fictibacillus sp. NE201]
MKDASYLPFCAEDFLQNVQAGDTHFFVFRGSTIPVRLTFISYNSVTNCITASLEEGRNLIFDCKYVAAVF